MQLSEAATGSECLIRIKVFFEILENSQENICPWVSFLIKLQVWSLQHF